MYSELDVVNACLASMGEAPVPNLTMPHPYIAAAIKMLTKHNKLVQSQRWWFNTTKVTLTPVAPTYTVSASLPTGAVHIQVPRKVYTLNGDGTVYDHTEGEVVTAAFDAFVIRELDYEALPPEANAYIADCTVLEFQSRFDGDSTKAALLREQKRDSFVALNAQNTRLLKPSMFSRIASKLNDIRGDRPFLRGQE